MPPPYPGPAYRIETTRLVLRCWNPVDAPLLQQAVLASLDHLLPWMPWAKDDHTDLQAKIERLRDMRAKFDRGEEFVLGIFDRAETRVLGGTGLHLRRGPHIREIGYWIHKDFINQGYATELSAALTKVAFEIDGMHRMEIRCDPDNGRSAAVPRKLGYTLESTVREDTPMDDGTWRDTQVWALLQPDYAATPAAQAKIVAFDAMGRRLMSSEQ